MIEFSMNNLIKLIKVQLGIKTIHSGDRFMEDLGTESVDILNIIALVEDSFQVDLDESKLADIRSVQDLYDLIHSVSR